MARAARISTGKLCPPDRATALLEAVIAPGDRVTIEGEFGLLRVEIENVPSENPRTGKLSYLSTIAFLRDLSATLRVGT